MILPLLLPASAPALPTAETPAAERASALDRIGSDRAFDALARTEAAGRFLELPQVMFAIDRSAKPPRVHWINTRRYPFHLAFIQARHLTLADADAFNAANYSRPDRRFVLGSVVRYPRLARYGVELWEGDAVEPELLAEAMRALRGTFHAPLTFKPNSDDQRAAAERAGLPTIGVAEAYGAREQLVLNGGRAVGRLVVVRPGEEDALEPGDIALLSVAPIRLPPVAGVIASSFATPVGHVSLLAKTWRIPNVYRAEADRVWGGLAGRQVVLDADGPRIALRPATPAEVAAAAKARAARAVRVPAADLAYAGLPSLDEEDRGWARRTGVKAANLGEVAALARRKDAGFAVPPGFGVPFAFYDRFVAANGIGPEIGAVLADRRLGDPAWRRDALAQLRARFAAGRVPPTDAAAIEARRRALLGDGGVFVRSSTNAEDLPGFNGAGLYDTVPNVRGAPALEAALRTVWGSLWNDRAFAARAAAGIDQRAVRAAVLIQQGVDADAAGVLVTLDPFDERAEERRVFIAAKRGVGIRVVEGRKVAEQLIWRPDLDSVQVLTRSQDDLMLHFAADGGVEEVRVDPNRAVLTDDLVRRLGAIGLAIQARFGGRAQDVEWLVKDGRVMVVQSRDYVRGR